MQIEDDMPVLQPSDTSELNRVEEPPNCFFVQGRATKILYILPITEKKKVFNISLFNSTPIPVPFFGHTIP